MLSRSYLTLVLLRAQFELDVRVTQAVLVHGEEVTTLDESDAHDAPPQLRLSVQLRQPEILLLLRSAHTSQDIKGLLQSKPSTHAHAQNMIFWTQKEIVYTAKVVGERGQSEQQGHYCFKVWRLFFFN